MAVKVFTSSRRYPVPVFYIDAVFFDKARLYRYTKLNLAGCMCQVSVIKRGIPVYSRKPRILFKLEVGKNT